MGLRRKKTTLVERILEKIDYCADGTDCWLWTGCLNRAGNMQIRRGRRGEGKMTPSRAMYEERVGPVPDGQKVYRACSSRRCVNPEHLFAGTPKDKGARTERPTHCPQGHEYTDANTYVNPRVGSRHCRKCLYAATARWRKKCRARARRGGAR